MWCDQGEHHNDTHCKLCGEGDFGLLESDAHMHFKVTCPKLSHREIGTL